MKIKKRVDLVKEEVNDSNAKGIKFYPVITAKDGAPNFNLRALTIEKGGMSPNHTHPWEHEFFIISGSGMGVVDNNEVPVKQGDVIFVPPDVQHCFRAYEKMEVL